MTFSEKLKLLRLSKELTQLDLSNILQRRYKHCGITRDDIAGWEMGRHQPLWPNAIILSKFFSVTLDDLFMDDKTEIFKPLKAKINSMAA